MFYFKGNVCVLVVWFTLPVLLYTEEMEETKHSSAGAPYMGMLILEQKHHEAQLGEGFNAVSLI